MSQDVAEQRGPLAGVRVLDLTRVLSGPYCALMLGELGAEVIKIEAPGRGDHSRRKRGGPKDTGLRFVAWNIYRKSVTLNVWDPDGREIFKKLVAESDVVLENYRPGVLKQAGLDYETLRAVNPKIVMASITGFGQDTPYAQYPAHASVVSAFTGVQSMNRFGDGPPIPTPGASPDIVAGTHAAIGVLGALVGRNASNRGRHVDVSMVDCMAGQIAHDLMFVLLTGRTPNERELRAGDGHSTTPAGPAFHECYRARDGWFYMQADLPRQWEALAKTIGAPHLLDDPRFSTEEGRSNNRDELGAIFTEWLSIRTTDEAFHELASAGVPCSPAHTLQQAAHHPYLRERGIVQEVEDPLLGKVSVITPRLRFAGEPILPVRHAPSLGEHNAEILEGIAGIDATAVAGLQARGVV